MSEINCLKDYIYTKQLNLDLPAIKQSSFDMYQLILKKFNDNQNHDAHTTLVSNLFTKYNLLLYPYPEFHNLYDEIRTIFHELNENKDLKYYIQCWLNFYHKGQFIDWHYHRKPGAKSWHGFYCVNCEPEQSSTTYKFQDGTTVDVPSKNNLLVMSKSEGDYHRTWPWTGDEPRITIAFDIVPQFKLNPTTCPIDYENHWMPI